MNTKGEQTAGGRDVAPTPAIVRSPRVALVALAVGAVTVAMHAGSVSMDAALPVALGTAGWAELFATPLSGGARWLADIQAVAARWLHLGEGAALTWPLLTSTALTVALLSAGLARTGLGAGPAGLLALVAAGGPLVWSQATSPFGAPLVTLVAAAVLFADGARASQTPRARLVRWTAAALGIAVSLMAGAPLTATLAGMAAETGRPGVVLLGVAVAGRLAGDATQLRPLPLLVAGWGLAAPLGPVAQVAAAVPFLWSLVAQGILVLTRWRGVGATRRPSVWLVLALMGWAVVQHGGRPWSDRRETTRVAAHWARAVAAAATADAPAVIDDTPAGLLVAARLAGHDGAPLLTPPDLRTRTGPALLLPSLVPSAAWSGLVLDEQPPPLASLADVLGALPSEAIAVVAVAAEAAPLLSSADWHALTMAGGRASTAGAPRARVLVGAAGTRDAGLEAVGAQSASLDVLAGDLIGASDRPSPLDLRVEAGTRDVVVVERGRVRAAARNMAVLAYRRNGELLAAWTGGPLPGLSAGVPGTVEPPVALVTAVLPCREIPAGTTADVTPLVVDGLLGVQAPTGTSGSLTLTWPDGHPMAVEPVRPFTVGSTEPKGIVLQGRPTKARWEADGPARVCQAPAVQPRLSRLARTDVAVHPRERAAFGGGWHDVEPVGDGRHFRWMAASRATLLIGLDHDGDSDGDLGLTLRAQSVGAPQADDAVVLEVNGERLDTRPLVGGMASYTWVIPARALRAGLNELTLETSLVLRPSDVMGGTDGRLLGLAVHGWTLEPVPEAGRQG